MSLEESLQLLTTEIKQLILLLKINNELLQENISRPISSIKRNKTLTEAEAAKYFGMIRNFLAQDRMNGYRENRTKGPSPIKISYGLE